MASAAYLAAAAEFGRRVQWTVTIDLPRCGEDYTGNGSNCTASDAGDGSRCYYSYDTCQDQTNFSLESKILLFCLTDVAWTAANNPSGNAPAYPYLKKIIPLPQKIESKKMVTWPDKVKIEMSCDWDVDTRVDLDKTTRNTGTAGEFWRNIVARFRSYQGRNLKIYKGFDSISNADFNQVGPTYELSGIHIHADKVIVEARSPIVELEKRKVPFEVSDDNITTVTDSATTITVDDGSRVS